MSVDAVPQGRTGVSGQSCRVVVARAFSLIVRVLLRKGRRLHIDDGIWASLSDSWIGKITLPARFNGFHPGTFVDVAAPSKPVVSRKAMRAWRRWRSENRALPSA